MRRLRILRTCLLAAAVTLAASCRRAPDSAPAPTSGSTTVSLAPVPRPDSVLSRRGATFYLHGAPFTEISFNKFDLFWQMLAAEFGRKNFGSDPLASAERSLATLHGFGFKTIRIFLNDYGDLELSNDAALRLRYLQTVDRTLDLCDKYDIRVVACLGLGDEKYARATGETWVDLIAKQDSQARKLAEAYARAIIGRYKDRPTIAMWEIQNELLLAADIGGKERVWNKKTIPSLTEVVRFHKEMSAFFKSIDSKHLVSTGDSYRTSLWHQNQHVEHGAKHGLWTIDSWAQLSGAVASAQAGADVFGIHAYEAGADSKFTLEPDGSRRPVDYASWVAVAAAQHQPLYIGELGALARARDAKNADFWNRNPDWFTSYAADREKALPIVAATLEKIVSARVPLTHWWACDSARKMDQSNPQRMDFTPAETPEFIALVADANRRLQLAVLGFTYVPASAPKATPPPLRVP